MNSNNTATDFSNRTIRNIQTYWHIYLTLLIFIVTSIAIAWIYRNQINPDGVSYIQVARHYASFDFKTAINGYWAPLLSWLLVPFLWLHIDPLFSFRIINFLLPLAVISGLLYYLNSGKRPTAIERYIQFAFLSSFGILLGLWSSATVTPDLLSGVMLGLVMLALYAYLKKSSLRYAILFGASLSMMYFSKSIGFYVSVALILAVLAREFYKKKHIAKNSFIALAVFAASSLIWIGAISFKYDKPTISTASSYNFALYGPTHPPHPQTVEGYLPVRHDTDLWGWDDPSYFTLPSWKISENVSYYTNYVLKTTNEAFSLLLTSSPLIYLGLVALFVKKKDTYLDNVGYYLGFCSLLIFGAYSLIYVEPRYLWFIALPTIAFGATLIKQKISQIRPLTALLSIILIATSFSLVPVFQNGYEMQLKQGDLKFLSQESKQHLPDYAKVASAGKFEYCYFSNTQCVGYYTLNGIVSHDQGLIQKMRTQGIQYYVDFSGMQEESLTVVYHGESFAHTCFDYDSGKNKACPRTTLTVYKL